MAEVVVEPEVIEPAVVEEEIILGDQGIVAEDIVDSEVVDGEVVDGEVDPEEPELDEKGRYVLPEGLVYDDWDRPINPKYPERNPFTGEYWGRVERAAREKRPKY